MTSTPANRADRDAAAETTPTAEENQAESPESVEDEPEHAPESPADGPRSPLRRALGILGPGLVTGVADDDPSGVATYSQAGAMFGMGMLWTAPLTLPLMYGIQEICDRTALATGDSLGALARRKFTHGQRWVVGLLVVALIVANTLNVAADLVAIGSGMQLLGLGSDHLWAAIAGVGLTAAMVFGSFRLISSVFKWLCLVLLAYGVVVVVAKVPWGDVAAGLVGLRMSWTWASAGLVVAVLGTTISPYMFFWESAQRIEEMRDDKDPRASRPLLWRSRRDSAHGLFLTRVDVFVGMLVSVLGMFAIMVATAATVGRDGPRPLTTAADAAKALEPAAGSWATALFAVGFIATGVLAVPVLAGAGSVALASLLGQPWGLNRSPRKAPLFYGLVAIATLGGVVASAVSSDPVGLLVLSAVINGVAAAPFVVVVMLVSRDRDLMGDQANGRLSSFVGWLTAAIMGVAGIVGLYVVIAHPV